MTDFLAAVLRFQSPGLRQALGRRPALAVPTSTVRASRAIFDVTPVSAETLEMLFASIAAPPQRRRLKRDGRVRFIYVLEGERRGQEVLGGFRIEAKAVNGRFVLITCHNLRCYPGGPDRPDRANWHD